VTFSIVARSADGSEYGVPVGHAEPELDHALAGWAGVLEKRLVPGRIDPTVLRQLRALSTPTTGSP
jgi:hypothetical protein